MRWDDLRIFLFVAREGGLTGAARRLGHDPATLGRRIARLEGDLGQTLFAKGPQGYRPTEAGGRLMRRAEAVEREALGAEADLRGGISGPVRIGAPDGCATYLMPQVAASLCDENPDLSIEIVALPRIFDLSAREADMAVGVSRPESGRLKARKIADYSLSLAAHRGYLARHPPISTVADLAGHRFAGYVPDMIFDDALDYLAPLGAPPVTLASSSVVVQARWVAAGAGIGIVHDFMLPDLPGVERVLPDAVHLTRAYWLVRPDEPGAARHDAVARALAHRLRAEIAARGPATALSLDTKAIPGRA